MFIQKEIKSILASLAVALIVAIVSLTYNTIKDLKTSVDNMRNSNDMRDVIQDNKINQFQSNVMDHFHEIDSNINTMHGEFDKVKFFSSKEDSILIIINQTIKFMKQFIKNLLSNSEKEVSLPHILAIIIIINVLLMQWFKIQMQESISIALISVAAAFFGISQT